MLARVMLLSYAVTEEEVNNGRPGGPAAALGVAGFPGHSTLASLFYNSWETPTAGDAGERHKASDSLEGGSLVLRIPH